MTLPASPILASEAGATVAKVLRSRLAARQPSWNDVKSLIHARRVVIDGTVCTDFARRVKENEVLELVAEPRPLARSAHPERLTIRALDDHIVVVEKPAGVNSVRHPLELAWSEERRRLDPTLQDLAQWAVAGRLGRPARSLPPLRIVHRLDKETSGLLVFARSAQAERGLGLQFRRHSIVRRYLALVPGVVADQTFRSRLVKDRGDGRRGSTPLPRVGKMAVTHVTTYERIKNYTMLMCRLETGRTHQIRIHLSEAGHPICGDKVYVRRPDGSEFADHSQAPRLALHALELGFDHPVDGSVLHYAMPLPNDLAQLVERLRGQ